MIIRERELNWLKEWKNKDLIKVITGVRRSGKSTIMFQYKDWLLEKWSNLRTDYLFKF